MDQEKNNTLHDDSKDSNIEKGTLRRVKMTNKVDIS